MLDPKIIRDDPEMARQALRNRGYDLEILERFIELDNRWRTLIDEGNRLKAEKNKCSLEIPKLPKEEKQKKIVEMRAIGDKVQQMEMEQAGIEKERDEIVRNLPNVPHPSVPVGSSDNDDVIVRSGGQRRKFDFKPQTHWEIGERLDIIDFERGTKIAGAGFYVLKGMGARLERALINFMLDLHIRQGYKEIFPTVVINDKACYGTGQLPKMREDMYHIESDGLWLNPTAEVPVTNLHMDEILTKEQLPIYYDAYLPSFRREAGKHIETKGIGRVHEFNKVELVKFVMPETSEQELESLLTNAEEVVQHLGLPYRIKLLCTGNLGFAASKTYDIDAYSPGMDQWLECSSCSNFTDFQARRARIKFRREEHLKSEFVHTLNGSGIALPRTMISVLENFQMRDGSIEIPSVLHPYLGGKERIE